MKTHHQVAANDQQQASAHNALGANPVGQKPEPELADCVEKAVSKNNVCQFNASQSRDTGQERKSDAEVLAAEIESCVGDPCDSKGLSLTDSWIHSLQALFRLV